MQVQETKIDRDVIVQLSRSSPVASSKRSSTDSFSKSNFAKLLVLPPQLCQARSALQLATLHGSSRRQTSTRGAPCSWRPFLAQFSSAAKQQLLQPTSTAAGEPSSKRHPVHCPNVTMASGGPTRFVKTLKQCHVSELDSLPRQAQSFQQDKHEDKRSGIWIIREEEKKNPTCNASASTSEGEGDRHPAVRTRAEKRQLERRWKTKDASTTRCVHINTASPASNLDTLTISQY